jgi:hypothetical protein
MGKIDKSRVLLGGFAAGLVIVIGEYILNGIILVNEFSAQREKYGLGDPTAAELTVGAIITVLYGVILIWIYAVIRPRFGPGPRTALIAAATFWAIAYVLFLGSLWANSIVSVKFAVVSILWGMVEAPIAALIGAGLYRENSSRSVAPA